MRARNRLSEALYRGVPASRRDRARQPIRRCRGTRLSPSGPRGSAGRSPWASRRARRRCARRTASIVSSVPVARVREVVAHRAQVRRAAPLRHALSSYSLGASISGPARSQKSASVCIFSREIATISIGMSRARRTPRAGGGAPRAAARACSGRSSSAASARRTRRGSSTRARARSARPARRWS